MAYIQMWLEQSTAQEWLQSTGLHSALTSSTDIMYTADSCAHEMRRVDVFVTVEKEYSYGFKENKEAMLPLPPFQSLPPGFEKVQCFSLLGSLMRAPIKCTQIHTG